MAKGAVEMSTYIAKLRKLQELPRSSTTVVKKAIAKEIERHTSAGTEPDGTPWKPRKRPRKGGGKEVLRNAAAAVRIASKGLVFVLTIEGHHARHHIGAIRSNTRRRIIPSKQLPDPYGDAIRAAVRREFRRIMK